jgi:aspartyl-tRNA(Asn)/glutamyl-tRNA(Gln) amidotransferase subunit A
MSEIAKHQAALRAGKCTARSLTQQFLERISRANATINAYLHVDADAALTMADAADRRLQSTQDVTPLTGIVLGIKDVMHCQGMPTTCASKMLEDFTPTFSATAVSRLQAAGAVILGKTNMDEFAMGASNENSAFGAVKNPWNLDHVPGGSSGGSAAAVAGGLCVGSLGSDTGGSIRQPAAFCGIVGIKPTYGRVSRYGLVAFASSLDQIGPMAPTVTDATHLLQVIAGHDAADSTSRGDDVPDWGAALTNDVTDLTIGIPQEYFVDGIAPDVATAVETAIGELENLGATIKQITLPHTKYAVPCYYIIAPAEASANLARFDGVRYGHRTPDAQSLRDLYRQSRSEGFGPEVMRRIMIGTYVLSSGYYDAYYLKALQVRTLIAQDFCTAFADVDIICTPTAPQTAFPLGAKRDDPVEMYLADICTSSCNLAGLPALSLPCGRDRAGLPIGLQLIGKHCDEASIIRAAFTYEQATPWHTEHAPFVEQWS